MKGREAARAAQRRELNLQERVAELETALTETKRQWRTEVAAANAENLRLRSAIHEEAQSLAESAAADRIRKYEQMLRDKGMHEGVLRTWVVGKDKFLRNAARYVSMTTGEHPADAIQIVVTWMTDRPWEPIQDVKKFCLRFGLPPDGWVARWLKRDRFFQKTELGSTKAVNLDVAIAEKYPRIHPAYQDKWYPPLKYGGELTFTDDDEETPQ